MRIAIASGKGGTGKTTLATSLALSLAAQAREMTCAQQGGLTARLPLFLDCDVEAPNAHLFLKPELEQSQPVGLLIPQVDEARCTHCGLCARICAYHAIAVIRKKTLVFPQLCHGCGSCTLLCPEGAISEQMNVMGILERGFTPQGIDFAHGVLNIGEAMAVPVIRQLKRWASPQPGQVVIVDAPPGSSCPVVETVRGADYLVLVTEPTPFGFHDLKMAVEVARQLGIPVGVVMNRDGISGTRRDFGTVVDDYCNQQELTILLRIPFDRVIAEGVAEGRALVEIQPHYLGVLQAVYARITEEVAEKTQAGLGQPG